MNDESLIQDFFKDARKRAQEKGPVPESALPAEDSNILHAAMGFGFRCGVCKKRHTSSITKRVPSLMFCVNEIVRRFGAYQHVTRYTAQNRRVTRKQWGSRDVVVGLGVRFIPSAEDPEALVFTYKEKNVLDAAMPDNRLFPVLYPKLHGKALDACERFRDVWNREIVEELSIREILAAPDSFGYVEARRDPFLRRALDEYERLKAEQAAAAGDLFEKIKKYRTLKPEKFIVTDPEHGHYNIQSWFRKRAPGSMIKRVTVNGDTFDYDRILMAFGVPESIGGLDRPAFTALKTDDAECALFDLGLVDGYPTVSWGIVQVQKKGRHKYVAMTAVNFVSTWNGRHYLNVSFGRHGPLLSDILENNSLVEITPGIKKLTSGEEPG